MEYRRFTNTIDNREIFEIPKDYKQVYNDLTIVYGCIYVYRNIINNKCYVGKTIHPLRRHKSHIRSNDNLHFHKAIKKYGIENFKYFIVFGTQAPYELINEILNEQEKYWINYFDSLNNGYNMTIGGDGHCGVKAWNSGKTGVYTKEQLEKISINTKKAMENIHYHHTPETIEKCRQAAFKRKGYCWVNNNGNTTMIPKEKLDYYLLEGWQLGRINKETD